jgi:hypothetical protein
MKLEPVGLKLVCKVHKRVIKGCMKYKICL